MLELNEHQTRLGTEAIISYSIDQAIEDFVDYYNQRRYHEALDNLTPEMSISEELRR
jgi:hypothetical protein